MTQRTSKGDSEPLAALVESVTSLAEDARLHGPAPDCATRMSVLIEKHRNRIEAARRGLRETGHTAGAAE